MIVVIFGGEQGMDNKDKIEIARNILHNAANINMSIEILLEISKKIDKYVVEYYRNCRDKKDGVSGKIKYSNFGH